ncbi:hypothetical protein [Thermomonas sp.]|uniref:hypothetical protein n=1 Tax=Thermomonas sp. TaxID=1971895 RepID=UPI0026328194|nr:hypothetical protein [Thermomonas sp.]
MGGTWLPDEYWHGTFFNLPGSGDQELLINEDSAHVPADGHEYPAVTKAGSVARCVQTDASATAANQGEGFEVVTQDGVIYTLNHMVLWNQPALKRATAGGMPSVAPTYNLPRWEYFLYPTKVMDRFGNTVDYIWNTSEPAQLLRIQSSDGRMIVFTYLADGSNRIASVSDGTRTWDYTYGPPGASGNSTDTVRLPDGTQWSYRLASLHHMINQPSTTAVNCAGVAGVTQRTGFDDGSSGTTYTGSITGPSGASVTFSLARVLFGRSHLAYNCVTDGDDSITARPADPYLFMSAAVVGKTITGPGLPAQGLHWSYVYGPTNNCWAGTYSQGVACTANSPTTRSVIVTDPDGSQTRYTFGNRANVDEGLLYTTESGWNGSGALRTTEITYAEPNTAPFGPFDGWSLRGNGDYAITSRIRPQRKVVTTQQGRSFVWEVASDCAGMPYCFDAFARPTRVIRSSTP